MSDDKLGVYVRGPVYKIVWQFRSPTYALAASWWKPWTWGWRRL